MPRRTRRRARHLVNGQRFLRRVSHRVPVGFDSDPDTDNPRAHLQFPDPDTAIVATAPLQRRFTAHHLASFIESVRDAQNWILGVDGSNRRIPMYRSVNHTFLTPEEQRLLYLVRELYKRV
ncbi:hypothetical protein HMPREF1624_03795 [Sporothrix schenckii ATCC 58251]|uniref:Uncharacterized protein n=1 Tax=Sporothrix schenckii (strain ATCC 58251 / de Perez 2211183) TaxID=1391915 RepID=U7PXS2_SPOS1|nr:hypothetical protein HMPREF1624_03795 [Sporothrix schenckii ATCC 58251]